MLDLIDQARHAPDLRQAMASVVQGLAGIVSCDVVAFSELDVPTRRVLAFEADDGHTEGDAEAQIYFRWHHQYPGCRRVVSLGADAGVHQRADFLTTRELHQLGVYQEVLRPMENFIGVPLSTAPGRTRLFQLFRADLRPFSDRDRLVLTLLQPHLYAVYREAAQRQNRVSLTGRQLEVMRCVALGMSNDEIARQLVVASSTVRKHLENVFQRTGVRNRAAAVARIFPDPTTF